MSDPTPLKFPQRVRALVMKDPLLWAVFAVLWICTLIPIWVPRFLPLLDLPNHLDAIGIWHRYYDPAWKYSEFYDLQLSPVPYWGYHFPVHMLGYLVPLEYANKIYLSAYALALPLGCALLAGRMGRTPWMAVFTWPLVFNMNFMFGFITCCAGLAQLPFCIYALDLYLEAPTKKRAFGLCLAVTLLYFTHVLPWMYFGVAAGFLLFCHGWHPRRIASAAALMMPSLLIAIIGWKAAASGNFTDIKAKGSLQFEAKWEKMQNLLSDVPNRLVTQWQTDDKGYWFLLFMASLWLIIVLTQRKEEPAEPRPGFRWRLEVLFFLAVLAVFKLPIYQKKPIDLWMVGGRFVTVVAMWGALLPRGPLMEKTGRRRWLLVPLVAACIWYPLMLNKHWMRFDKRASGMRRLMSKVERGSSTLTLVMGDTNDPDADPQAVAWLQFHSYAQFYGGGYNPWALQTGFPMVAKKEMRKPAPTWKSPQTFRMDDHGIHYDYVLTLHEPMDHALFGPSDAHRARLVGKDGAWRLYQIFVPKEP
jgi:hypothetical protein